MRNNKRVAIFLGHPAHFHLFKNAAKNLIAGGYDVTFAVKRKDIVEQLVKDAGFKYIVVRDVPRKKSNKLSLVWSMIKMDWKVMTFLWKYHPKVFIGTYGFWTSLLYGCPFITCNEDDAAVVPHFAHLSYPTASAILTPVVCNNGHWDTKSLKYPGYHELAYLHPNHFTPDPKIVEAYGIDTSKPYFVMRFASLNAHHDSGIKGINTEIAQRLIDILENSGSPTGLDHFESDPASACSLSPSACSLSADSGNKLVPQTPTDPSRLVPLSTNSPSTNSTSGNKPRIYITSERPLEPQFEKYRIKINPLDMHHVMAFASLYIGDSQTMAAEAGVLGVPFVRFNDFVGRIGYLRELEDKYELGYGIKASAEGSVDALCERVETLVSMPSAERKATFAARREKMLEDKIDCAKFLTYFIKNYPTSAQETRNADSAWWQQFK